MEKGGKKERGGGRGGGQTLIFTVKPSGFSHSSAQLLSACLLLQSGGGHLPHSSSAAQLFRSVRCRYSNKNTQACTQACTCTAVSEASVQRLRQDALAGRALKFMHSRGGDSVV